MSDSIQASRVGRFWASFKLVDHWLLRVEQVGMVIAAAFIAGVFLLLVAGVFARPWTGFVFSLSLEASSMAMWPISYMGAAFIWRVHGHPQFDLFLRKTRGRKHHILQTFNNACALMMTGYLAWFAWESYLFHYYAESGTQNLRYPFWPFYWAGFVGLGLLFVEVAFSLLRHLREVMHPTGVERALFDVYTQDSATV